MKKLWIVMVLTALIIGATACSTSSSNTSVNTYVSVQDQSITKTGFRVNEDGYLVGYGSFAEAMCYFDGLEIIDTIVGWYYEDEAVEMYYNTSMHAADSNRDIEEWENVDSFQDILDIWGFPVMWDYVYGSCNESDIRGWYH